MIGKTACLPEKIRKDKPSISEPTNSRKLVAQSTLSQILAGKRGISKATAKKLGVFFGISSVVFL
jgi:plasmid maintenance system antidote protein VapI